MKPDCKKTVSGQLNIVDRLSDLPDFILHRIISFLGTREAYRTSILSKKWYHISATNPVLEIHYYRKGKNFHPWYWPSKEVSTKLLEYIDTRMRRYSNESLRIRTLTLRLPNSAEELVSEIEELTWKVEELELSRRIEELSCKVAEWLRIAVCNHVAKLDIDGPLKYQLPDILLSAKSLERLDCYNVKIPYYSKEIDLVSLNTLRLRNVVVEDRMLNHIIRSCVLLKYLSLDTCSGLETIVIPCFSQVEKLDLYDSLPKNGTVILETSSLTCFDIVDILCDGRWPVISRPGLLRNLKKLDIYFVSITDEAFGKLLCELSSLETLKIAGSDMLSTIRISSNQLKEVRFNHCRSLIDVRIDAPNLKFFKYVGDFDHLLFIAVSSLVSCYVSLHTTPYYLDTEGFLKLKKLLTGISNCNVLKISLIEESNQDEFEDFEIDKEELENANLGPPCEIRELKLNLTSWILPESSLPAFLDGLFWTCHPDIISFRVRLRDPNSTIEPLISELEEIAKRWSHPLKRVEVEGSNCSNLFKSSKLDIQLRLYW